MQRLSLYAAFSLLVAASTLGATPITWAVSVGGGIPLGPVQGAFTYDADTNTILNYNLFAGNSLFIGPCNAPGAIGAPNPCGTGTDFAYVSQGGTEAIFGAENGNGFYTALILDLSAPLTDAASTICIIPGSCIVCSGPGFNNGSSDSGSGLVYEPGGGWRNFLSVRRWYG